MDKASVSAVGIVGVSGYSGIELARIVAGHPRLALALAISDKWAGSTLGDHLALSGAGGAVQVRPQKEATAAAFAGLDVVFLCTPAEASLALAPIALEAGARVVDLSGAFRLAANEYPRWYGFTHARPDLLPAGLLLDARGGRVGRHPGGAAGVEPGLLRHRQHAGGAGAAARRDHRAPTASSSTPRAAPPAPGARRARTSRSPRWTATSAPIACCATSTRPRSSARWRWPASRRCKVTFTPHLLPTRRGILATVYGRLSPGKTGRRRGRGDRALRRGQAVPARGQARRGPLAPVVGTNRVLLGADADPERGVAVAFAAIDNLVKGAAGQAVQNANLMLGFDETTGLLNLPGSAP